ncbi:hypothetical protein DSO57_1003084 [Entomophthora muscae]|uniref:Uncharacterized protein n=1 Tax=Entomophthora muscae TaxID=34485 RepID=A0ACC2UI89_9FUNG|nr:hypothetical protein DSO57_1003084 [Entomophthora muscae]
MTNDLGMFGTYTSVASCYKFVTDIFLPIGLRAIKILIPPGKNINSTRSTRGYQQNSYIPTSLC